MKVLLTFGKRALLLALLFILGLSLTGALGYLIGQLPVDPVAATRITAIVQNLLTFILPAVVLAMIVTRLPAEYLYIKEKPDMGITLMAVATLLCAMPALNCVIELCDMIPWPEAVVAAEETARQTTTLMLGNDTAGSLIVSLLIIGVLTGLGEELFFRGALLRTLLTRPMGVHAAIWLTAVIFSLMHGQMIGFLPRVLLGAYFGYVTLWSGSLWVVVICHALNNSAVVIMEWAGIAQDVIGLSTPALSIISLILTLSGLYLMYLRQSRSRSRGM